jgi:hypothetical protein
MASDALYLDEPLLEDALKTPYFFNGRLLTREDLAQEQLAQRTKRTHLGRALGSGTAHGLEVEPDLLASLPGEIVLNVAPGLAVTPEGETLHVPDLVRLRFSVRPDALVASGRGAGDFGDCGSMTSVTESATGLYLLVIRGAAGKEGLAAVSGLGNEAAPCNTKYRTAGIAFRALGLGTSLPRNDALFRSKFATECFGFFERTLLDTLFDPFTGPAPLEAPLRPSPGAAAAAGYGKIDALRASGELSACEVPLAIVHLNDAGVLDFVDMWPVRRRLVGGPLTRRFWPFGGGEARRHAEAEAAFLCFQDHVSAIAAGAGLATATAESRFAFLPGGGFLPCGSGHFDPATFLGAGATAVVDADFGRIRALVAEACLCDAIDLGALSRPPLTYFVFAQAGGRWVFFLRRRTDLPVIIDDPADGSPPETPDIADTSDPIDAADTTAAATGALLVVVPADWRAKHGDPDQVWFSGPTPKRALADIEAKRAQELLERSVGVGSGREGKVKVKVKPVLKDATEKFARALFFYGARLEPGAYVVTVEVSSGEGVLSKNAKRQRVNVDARGVTVVVLT